MVKYRSENLLLIDDRISVQNENDFNNYNIVNFDEF